MAKSISDTSIKIGVDASAAPVEIEKLTSALDSISTTPLERLRDKSEEAAGRVNSAFAKTVQGVEDLKSQLASTGSLNTRLFKGLEADLGKLANLGIDEAALQKISNVLSEVRQASRSPITIRLEEERARAAASPVAAANPVPRSFREDPTGEAAIEAARARQYSPDEVERLNAIDAELKASRELDAQKQRAIAEQRTKEATAEKARRDDLSEQLKASRQLSEQKQKALDEQAEKEKAVADKRRKLLGDVTGKVFNAVGINLPEKAAGAIGVAGAIAAGALAIGRAGADVREAQRSSGISGSTLGNVGFGVQQLPVVRQISEAGEEFVSTIAGAQASLFRFAGVDSLAANYEKAAADLSPSGLKAEQDRLNESTAIYEELRVRAKDAAIAEARVLRDNEATIRSLNRANAATTLGGVARTRFEIAESTGEAIRASENKRDDTRADADRQISAIVNDTAQKTVNIRNTISGSSGKEAEDAKKELDIINGRRDAAIKSQEARKVAADAAAAAEAAALTRNGSLLDSIAAGTRENTAAVTDQIEGLAKSIRGVSGDPIDAMRRSFLELKPTAENLAKFNDQLARYKVVSEAAERSGARLSAIKESDRRLGSASTAGLNPAVATFVDSTLNRGLDLGRAINEQRRFQNDTYADARSGILNERLTIGKNEVDAEIERLKARGLRGDDAIKVRLELVENARLKLQQQVKDEVRQIDGEIAVTLARDPKARIEAEIARKDLAARAPDGKMPGLTDQEKDAYRKSLGDQYYSEQAKATIDATKTPQAKLAEAVDSLKEQYKRGYLSDEEAKRGLGAGLKDYADAIRTSRPELMQAGSAQTDQYLAIASGAVIDASKPELELAREANRYLETIAKAVGGAAPVSLGIVP